MKVIASAGSDAKVAYTRSLGADYAFNYKKKSYIEALKEYGPYEIFWVTSSLFPAHLLIPSRTTLEVRSWKQSWTQFNHSVESS